MSGNLLGGEPAASEISEEIRLFFCGLGGMVETRRVTKDRLAEFSRQLKTLIDRAQDLRDEINGHSLRRRPALPTVRGDARHDPASNVSARWLSVSHACSIAQLDGRRAWRGARDPAVPAVAPDRLDAGG